MSGALQVLRQVPDPEIPVVDVVGMGIVRAVEESPDGRRVAVTLTPTYSGCPATAVIERDVRTALEGRYDEVDIRVQLSPAWSTDDISPEARDALRGFGIAPPERRPVVCVHCASTDVEELSPFGSTPCKALWRCRACREPFDVFKCH